MRQKMYWTTVIVILDEVIFEGSRLEIYKVMPDSSYHPEMAFTRVEDLKLEHILNKIMWDKGLLNKFKRWYTDTIDTADSDPCYPSSKLSLSKYVHQFLLAEPYGVEICVMQDSIDINITLEA